MSSPTASATTPESEAGTPSAARPPQKPTSVGIPVFADTSYHSDHRAPTSPIPGAVIPDAVHHGSSNRSTTRSRFPVRSWVMPRRLAFGRPDTRTTPDFRTACGRATTAMSARCDVPPVSSTTTPRFPADTEATGLSSRTSSDAARCSGARWKPPRTNASPPRSSLPSRYACVPKTSASMEYSCVISVFRAHALSGSLAAHPFWSSHC